MTDPSSRSLAHVAFRYPNFRWYMAARFLVTVSSEMQSVAVGWQVYSITHRPLDLGLVGLAQFLPGILLFLIAGHIADRYPRQHILRSCYGAFSISSALLLAFTFRGISSPYPIYLALLWNGTVRAFAGPPSQAFLPLLVAREHFPNAVAWASSIFQTATIIGPVIGGVIYGVTGSPIAVYASAGVAYLFSLALMMRLKITTVERPPAAPSLAIVFEGLRFIGSSKLILGAISLDLFAVLLGRSRSSAARLRSRNTGRWSVGAGAFTKRPWIRSSRNGYCHCALAAAPARRENHAGLRCGVRSLHDRLRPVA